ncbi:MAG: GroES family chaperonin [Gammaproteobacteria bacterium]
MADTVPVTPLFNNVLCAREEETKYVGSLIIPDTAKERPMGARVLAVGPEVVSVAVGQFVLVGRFAGAEVKFRNSDYVVLRETEVLGIVNE